MDIVLGLGVVLKCSDIETKLIPFFGYQYLNDAFFNTSLLKFQTIAIYWEGK